MSATKIALCHHTLDNGLPCRAAAIRNKPYCYFHRHYYTPAPLPGEENYRAPLLESHHSIQIALTQLYQAFLSRKLDLKEANFALQVLRLAAKTVKATSELPVANDPQDAQASLAKDFEKFAEELGTDTMPESTCAGPDTLPSTGPATDTASDPKRGVYDPYGCLAHLTR